MWQARNDYDKAIRSQLSPEDYARYRAIEAERPAKREVEKINDLYQSRSGKSMDTEQRDVLVRLIQAAQTYTDSVTIYRPYDGMPRITVGTEAIIHKLEVETPRLAAGLRQLTASAGEAGVPQEYQALVADYFGEEIKTRLKRIGILGQQLFSQPAKAPTPAQ